MYISDIQVVMLVELAHFAHCIQTEMKSVTYVICMEHFASANSAAD